MKWNTILHKLIPSEDKFFPILRDMSSNLLECSDYCIKLMETQTLEGQKELQKTIKRLETKGDGLIGYLYKELNDTFITPFDREDLHNLANKIDNVLDRINSTSKRVIMYEPIELPKHFGDMAHIVKEQCKLIDVMTDELKNVHKNGASITSTCDKLHILENKADDLYENFITDIFTKADNDKSYVLELVKLKEIMQELERTTDDADNVGKSIKTIVVKFA
ncbi:MAG: DUF47 family protein [Bacteroidales bacterium]|jgi:predicted phosphate transport protein (TIGR00153 family)|nr:DUF47 family protein [Bacteroidales bacterium]